MAIIPERTCPQCGRRFHLPPSRSDRTCCSLACSRAYRAPKPRACAHCGEIFTPSAANRNQPCCSRACGHAVNVRSLEDRFWERVHKTDSCWLWDGKWSSDYGRLGDAGHRTVLMHRFSWELHYGSIPDNLWVLHRCDNPSCVNPAHLFLGTHDDNMADMAAKHRAGFQQHPEKAPKGERHGNAKLTDENVRSIRRLRAQGIARKAVAQMFGISESNVKAITSHKAWPHIE